MTLMDAVRFAVSGLRGSMLRTLLTILGLGVGVGAVMTVLALGAAGEIRVEEEIARLGVDKVWITASDEAHVLTKDGAQLVREACGIPVCAGAGALGFVGLDEACAAAQITGYDKGMDDVLGMVIMEGRRLLPVDYEQHRTVCLIDVTLAESLGGEVLHRRISAGGRLFLVVGVAEGLPVQAMAAGRGMMVLPLTTYGDTYGGVIRELTLAVPVDGDAEKIGAQAVAALSDDGGFRADSLENEIDAARQVVRIFVMVLGCVAAVCMLTGAIGVMNVLLVSVRERRREIGLIKAVGGTDRQVGLVFLIEAMSYALLGGLLGIVLGEGMILLFGVMIGVEASLSLRTAVPVLAAAALLGAAFGVVPALHAAGMQPVDALRYE